MLAKLLTDFTQCINLHMNMTPMQIVKCAESLVSSNEFYMLRVEDYSAFFDMALSGQFGKIEYSIDQVKIFTMLREFMQQRDGKISRKRDMDQNANLYDLTQNPVMEKILGEVSAKFEERMNAEPVVFKHRELTPAEQQMRDLANEYFQEFDEIYAAMPNKPMGERMILVGTDDGETWMTAQEYVNYKLSR